MTELPCLQEVPPTKPVDEGDEGVWDTVAQRAPSAAPPASKIGRTTVEKYSDRKLYMSCTM
jgi:hypothetical protein